MPAVIWIVAATAAMALIALSGSILALPEKTFGRVVLPLVAVAAGSLLGGALFHLLPEAVTLLGNHLPVYGWVAAGVLAFFLLASCSSSTCTGITATARPPPTARSGT